MVACRGEVEGSLALVSLDDDEIDEEVRVKPIARKTRVTSHGAIRGKNPDDDPASLTLSGDTAVTEDETVKTVPSSKI